MIFSIKNNEDFPAENENKLTRIKCRTNLEISNLVEKAKENNDSIIVIFVSSL